MREILIFAGTTEGREMSELLCRAQIPHTVCVATEYGEMVLKEHPMLHIHQGRMDQEQIRSFLKEQDFCAVIDATHPFAKVVTENIKKAMEGLGIPYYRLARAIDEAGDYEYEKLTFFGSNEECAEALKTVEGNILLTTGSKELAVYTGVEELKSRLYVRVLPGLESLSICQEQGLRGKQIIAMQGPFTRKMNEAMLEQYEIQCLVMKQSGKTGGADEKVEAAKALQIPVYVIGKMESGTAKASGESSDAGEGLDAQAVCKALERDLQIHISTQMTYDVVLAGIGMGNAGTLTKDVAASIRQADFLFGAKRILESATTEKKISCITEPIYLAKQVIPYLMQYHEDQTELMKKTGNRLGGSYKVVVLLSGDTGYYSGAKNLLTAFQQAFADGELQGEVSLLPGISSVAYFSACIHESYEDAVLLSMHGKSIPNLARRIKCQSKTYLLTSGLSDVKKIGEVLLEAGRKDCSVSVGYQLSYPDQRIMTLTPIQCTELSEEGLYICCIKNENVEGKILTPHKKDEDFIRDRVPMTKEEVRQISICKLRLAKDSVVYDIGSGTGSIAVEMALLSDDLQVYAIEKKPEAVELIKKNRNQFGLENIEIVHTTAPVGMDELPTPTHAFVGGSNGNLKDILRFLKDRNPKMRVVINAISMETICEIREVLSQFEVSEQEVVQLQVSRSRKVGDYHLMQAENPVWICAFTFGNV